MLSGLRLAQKVGISPEVTLAAKENPKRKWNESGM